MQPTESEDYISIIALNFLYPLAKLIESIDEIATDEPNDIQSAPIENGYSLGIVVLAVLLIESVVNRVKYKTNYKTKRKKEHPLESIKKTFPDIDFYDRLEELFVIRDVIAHNHVWEAKIYWDENWAIKLLDTKLSEGYGDDNKFKKAININTRKTRLLGLNVFPNRICRSDAIRVLKNVVDFLLVIEKLNPNYFRITNQWVKYKGAVVTFTKLVSELTS